jgi:hypothetical protein
VEEAGVKELSSVEPSTAQSTEKSDDDDKMRRVKRLLTSGDRVESVYNVHRVAGVDTVASLLLFGRQNVYLLDGFFYNADTGEVLHAFEAPDAVYLLASSSFA